MPIVDGVADTIGLTPLVRLPRMSAEAGVEILAKLEARNPAGSVKDRIARAMVDDARERGLLEPGATLVEPTSGNTGIALAMIAAAYRYRLILTMPEAVSPARVALLRTYGAEVELTRGSLMIEAIHRAEVIGSKTPGAVLLRQFENRANPAIHERTTAEEIWRDTDGRLDVFVAGIGTGGTITGVGRVLKRRLPSVKVMGVEPATAAILTSNIVGNHQIQGIGAGFVPPVLDQSVVDEVLPTTDAAAFTTARRLAAEDGILAGISSGAALAAVLELARRPEHRGARFVVVFPDAGERYVNTPLLDGPAPARR